MHNKRRHFTALIAALALSASAFVAHAAEATKVLLKTSMGDIVLELNPEKAPVSVDNFLKYVKSGYYKGTIFHRVIDGFMIQGGGFDKNLNQKQASAPIKNEGSNGLKNDAYTVAMARTGDPDSATSQFFINVNNNGMLDYPGRDGYGYAVFGKVVAGQDVIDKIRRMPTKDAAMYQNVPQTPIVIESATLTK
ncbi:peptidylprolyl isomerase [Actimicrobium sp. CCI2.3]|uniref:peptidylprolyl isomerase n=1 Tax=Actimicrobium sp. CCI2.3 TaxID=3048616 RepID=UPI002AB4A7E8|nr:peptidylprolyl isomerase [Actimicrobium sp. CCI2.3]MDY7575373.1 peptidylprolyl isomerase [Actimicrobium sp. CCI2.3]MEB0021284.1 peptidylprolyl isomerase [Actimicrobium sp. CCI2.3]